MVSCESFQSYKVPLKNSEQSIIEHNLVTIYLSLEWPDNTNENPNLIIHIFDKKTSPKACKTEASMPSYFQPNQSSLLVNSIHHHHQQQPNFGSSYQQQYHHHYHHSSVLNNEPPTTTTTITTGDHNDVSSTTTTVVFSALQPPPPPSTQLSLPPPPPPPPSSHLRMQQIKSEAKPQPSPIYRRQPSSYSPPINASLNPQYLSAQHVIQTPSSNMESPSNMSLCSASKTVSPASSTNLPNKPTLTHVIDLQQSPTLSSPSFPLAGSTASSTFKAFVCSCAKPHIAHEQNCPALNLIKQQTNATLTSQTIVCRPPINRTIAQRAAVASQIRTNRAISITPTKEQGQPPPTTAVAPLLPFAISNNKALDSTPNLTTIVSQPHPNYLSVKKPIVRQNSIGAINPRQRKRRIMKQISLPNQDPSAFYNQIQLNDSKPQSTFMIKEELTTSPNPTVKLVSPFAIQTTVSNSDIDQTIDDVINGKGDISINDSSPLQTKPPPQQQQQQPSSQLVWVQNGTVTTKTWLSPLYQKQQPQQQQQQQQQQPVYDPLGSSLTHQDVVNIAQQVVFPTTNEQNQLTTVLQTPITNNSKKRNRSKSTAGTTTTTPKRIRNRKPTFDRIHSMLPLSSQHESSEKAHLTSPITPTLNLINKPIPPWSNIPTTPSSSSSSSVQTSGSTNASMLSHSNQQHLPSFEKNDSWQSQCVENVDAMLDEFHLATIDEQRTNSNHHHHHHHFDFDLSSDSFPSKTDDRFASSTPPPPLTIDNQRYALSSTDKLANPAITHSKLASTDIDVYDHFLNPYSSVMWQENQVSSSVSLPPDYHQINHFPLHHHHHHQQQQQQQLPPPPSLLPAPLPQQQYYSSQANDENFDSYNLQSQGRLLFDVQS